MDGLLLLTNHNQITLMSNTRLERDCSWSTDFTEVIIVTPGWVWMLYSIMLRVRLVHIVNEANYCGRCMHRLVDGKRGCFKLVCGLLCLNPFWYYMSRTVFRSPVSWKSSFHYYLTSSFSFFFNFLSFHCIFHMIPPPILVSDCLLLIAFFPW